MSGSDILQDRIKKSLHPHGLKPRGLALFGQDQAGPRLGDGRPARAVMLIGHVGGTLWPAFSAWRLAQTDGGGQDPLDQWSKAILRPIAEDMEATVFFPSDPPYQPFQQWAMRAEGLKSSPLGILIHPHFGLWHGYRAALAFGEWPDAEREGVEQPTQPHIHPCDVCIDKPCLTHCPVAAISLEKFDVGACRSHLLTEGGAVGCMQRGCAARNACPVGAGYAYGQDQTRFHMRALKRLM
ncbi:MAG: ferredoxin [Allorhizobium sp.]